MAERSSMSGRVARRPKRGLNCQGESGRNRDGFTGFQNPTELRHLCPRSYSSSTKTFRVTSLLERPILTWTEKS